MHWYLRVLKNYVTFFGRARRKEFWIFVLINAIISIVLSVIDHLIGTAPSPIHPHSTGFSYTYSGGLLSGLYGLAVLLPSLAVQFRRLHDTDRRGWWILIALIPVIGGIILLVFNVLPGHAGMNRFGADPRAMPAPEGPTPTAA